jgi:rhodanese-related sulfurtransferase
MHRLGSTFQALGAVLTILAATTNHPAVGREWMEPAVILAAEQMFAAMPDDYFTIKPVPANQEINTGSPTLIDVREPAEFQAEHIAGAKNIPVRQLPKLIDTLPESKTAPILTYCKSGHRGAVALAVLRMAGYDNVRNIYGGLDGWKAAGFPVTK